MPLMQEQLTVSDPEFLVTFISSDKSNSRPTRMSEMPFMKGAINGHTALAMRNAFDSFL